MNEELLLGPIYNLAKHCTWGQNRFICQAANDWNILSDELKSISDILTFKRQIRSIS